MNEKKISKIIYFDKETIQNILQEQYKGAKIQTTDLTTSAKTDNEVNATAEINLNVPFFQRLGFLFSGKLSASYILQKNRTMTITSTEISEFEKIKPLLEKMDKIQLEDIENSSTFFRVAGGYLRMVKGGVDGLDTENFNSVMDNYDGYDTYKAGDKKYVRFNNTAFVSNYKRNDLLITSMTLYCIPVGKFDKNRFDFMKELAKMEALNTTTNQGRTLADVYGAANEPQNDNSTNDNKVELYDVVYACIAAGDSNGET